jgi:hypothetical protein
MMGGMEKTTVYLTTEQKAGLERIAEAEGRSEARLIRAGIDEVIARHRIGEASADLAEDALALPVEVPSIERPRWIEREAFVTLVLRHQADAGLSVELRDLVPGTTDDEPLP